MLIDLINNKELKNQGYGIVHFDSPDERGVDVGLLFNTNRFTPIFTKAYSLYLKRENGETDFTRDHLLVSGYLDKELIYNKETTVFIAVSYTHLTLPTSDLV